MGKIKEIHGSIIIAENPGNVMQDELVKIENVYGKVIEVGRKYVIIQVLGSTAGLTLESNINFTSKGFEIPCSEDVLGRVFDGMFNPLDGLPPIISDDKRDINGNPINPAARIYPNNFIQTGISAIDACLPLIRGQKLPIFSESGLPHNRLIAQIARQATVIGKEEEFAIVFAAIGLRSDEAKFFLDDFRNSGSLERSVVILNLANDPSIERLFTPRIALTIAEYLAFDLGMHVLTILSDITNYCEALRDISVARKEIPGKGGYPGYLYSDLATIYERAGIIKGSKGSLTQLPCLTMPGGDLHHPIPDLTGYITEGQIFLDRDLHSRGIYPPINILPSLSRLATKGIGKGKTREDHKDILDQLYDSYSKGVRARDLARIIGEAGLSEKEKLFLKFAEKFEREFLSQGEYENRTIEETLDLAWKCLSILPTEELTRIRREFIEKWRSVQTKEI